VSINNAQPRGRYSVTVQLRWTMNCVARAAPVGSCPEPQPNAVEITQRTCGETRCGSILQPTNTITPAISDFIFVFYQCRYRNISEKWIALH
jgi:hypothetical protein